MADDKGSELSMGAGKKGFIIAGIVCLAIIGIILLINCLNKESYSQPKKRIITTFPSWNPDKLDSFEATSKTSKKVVNPYSDWGTYIKNGTLTKDIIQNHNQFVDERIKNKDERTGGTFSPDMHDSYDPTDWVGLRRPQAVPTDVSKQVPDIDTSLFAEKSTLSWN